jgi:hypothetical protein
MQSKVSPTRIALAAAATLAILFVLCWLGAVIWPAGLSHMFVALFTGAPVDSWVALGQGLCAAVVFGALGGAILGWTYNFSELVEGKR